MRGPWLWYSVSEAQTTTWDKMRFLTRWLRLLSTWVSFSYIAFMENLTIWQKIWFWMSLYLWKILRKQECDGPLFLQSITVHCMIVELFPSILKVHEFICFFFLFNLYDMPSLSLCNSPCYIWSHLQVVH